MNKEKFSFEISLSVLNHLGRNLYRSFITVLGEAISNSWDAEADNVWIYIDRESNNLVIKDDGNGMTAKDFQEKFLKVGYSKRKDGKHTSDEKDRPYIGRKGIGKLALLSCADIVTIVTKTKESDYEGGVIDNSELDKAIQHDLTPDQYPLEEWNMGQVRPFIKDHDHGTIICFNNIKDGIKNTIDYLKKTIALYFRFSLIDESFKIHLEDEEITINHLEDLAKNTEFLWLINDIADPFIYKKLLNPVKYDSPLEHEEKYISSNLNIRGFIASVKLPRHLKVFTTDERAGIDLFVNGRLRERDILKHVPTSRIVENYLYGQIHFDILDDDKDRFTSSREGVVADDPKFQDLLTELQKIINSSVIDDWDKWRLERGEEGDPENNRLNKRERKSRDLFNEVSGDYTPSEKSDKKKEIAQWIKELSEEGQYNFISYAKCFISENLIRKYIEEEEIELTSVSKKVIDEYKKREIKSKGDGNISIEIRKGNSDLSYLSMNNLAYQIDDKGDTSKQSLIRDSKQYKPIRDAIAHTAYISDDAKIKMDSISDNIKGRIKSLLNES